jgi:hypothetical protein
MPGKPEKNAGDSNLRVDRFHKTGERSRNRQRLTSLRLKPAFSVT